MLEKSWPFCHRHSSVSLLWIYLHHSQLFVGTGFKANLAEGIFSLKKLQYINYNYKLWTSTNFYMTAKKFFHRIDEQSCCCIVCKFLSCQRVCFVFPHLSPSGWQKILYFSIWKFKNRLSQISWIICRCKPSSNVNKKVYKRVLSIPHLICTLKIPSFFF